MMATTIIDAVGLRWGCVWCIYNCFHLDTTYPLIFILLVGLLFLCIFVLIILALCNPFLTNLHAESGDKNSNAWYSSEGQVRGEVGEVFCLVNVRLWNTSMDTHWPKHCTWAHKRKETVKPLIRDIHPSQHSKGRRERSFCQCHDEAPGQLGGRRDTGRYMERKRDEVRVIVRKVRVRERILQSRVK